MIYVVRKYKDGIDGIDRLTGHELMDVITALHDRLPSATLKAAWTNKLTRLFRYYKQRPTGATGNMELKTWVERLSVPSRKPKFFIVGTDQLLSIAGTLSFHSRVKPNSPIYLQVICLVRADGSLAPLKLGRVPTRHHTILS